MEKILYSHRLKSVLQHTVRDLGLTVTLDDAGAGISIRDNLPVIKETAMLLRMKVVLNDTPQGMSATFSSA